MNTDPQQAARSIREALTPDATAAKANERPIARGPRDFAWRFEEYDPRLSGVLPAIRRFASDVLRHRRQPEVTPYWLTILGPSGVGKTLILTQLFRYLRNRTEIWPIETRTGEREATCSHIKPGLHLEHHSAPREYAYHDLLYVEDIGAATADRGSGAVIMSRTIELLLYRPQQWTILDGNFTLEEMAERMDPRIVSRLKRDGSILVELPADIPDYNFR